MSDFALSTVYILYVRASALRIIYNNYYCRYCGCPPCVCVCACSLFLPPRASRPRNIGKLMYVFTAARKTPLYIIILILFAENASFRSYGVICLPRMPLTTPEPQNTDANGIHATLLFAVLTKNDSFRSYSTFVYLLRTHILNINTCTYTTYTCSWT